MSTGEFALLAEVASNDKAIMQRPLLDRAGCAGAMRALYEQIRKHVQDARDELPALQRNAKRLHTALQEFWELQAKRDKLQMLEKNELGDLQREIEWHPAAEQRLEGLKISLTSSASELPDLIVGHTKQVAIRHAT